MASERYLYDPKFKLYIHSQIADYFTGKWANKPKPFEYTPDQMRMFRLQSKTSEADRNVPEQPETYHSAVDNSEKYNGRKLSELPFHLTRSRRVDELFNLVFFRYKFLYAKLCCNPLNNVIADFEDFLDHLKYDKEVCGFVICILVIRTRIEISVIMYYRNTLRDDAALLRGEHFKK